MAHLVAAMLVVCMVSMLVLALLRVHMVLVAPIVRLMVMAMLVMLMLHMHVIVVASTGMDMLLLDALQADMHAMSSAQEAWGTREDSSEALSVSAMRDRSLNWLRIPIGMSLYCLQGCSDNDARHASSHSPP